MCCHFSVVAPPQVMEPITKLDENKTSKIALVEGDDCMDKPSHSESVKENNEGLDDKAIDSLHSEGDKLNEHNATSVIQTQGSTSFKDQTDINLVNEPIAVVIEHSNGFACEESLAIASDGPCNSADANNNPIDNGKNMNTHPSADQVSRSSATPTNICLYRFCSKCIFNLQSVIQKTLISQWDVKSSNWTTEDVHDAVTSLSLHLYTTVREFCVSGSRDNIRTLFEGQEVVKTCECEVSVTTGMECGCHLESSSSSGHGHGVDSELIYKNGVVSVLDPETDVSFHCKFQTLCLCSLIDYIVMTKKPSG